MCLPPKTPSAGISAGVRRKSGVEVAPCGCDQDVTGALLHPVVHFDPPWLHRAPFAALVAGLRRQMAKLRADAKLTQAK